VINFKNQSKRSPKVIIDQTPYDQAISESSGALWEVFEKTGSVKDYLRFIQKLENREEFELVPTPTQA